MKLHLKILLFILALIGSALWANIHFSRVAVTEAMTAQIAEAGEIAAAGLTAELRRALKEGDEQGGIKTLHDFARRTGALYAAAVLPDGLVVAHTNVALAGSYTSDPLLDRAARAGTIAFSRAARPGEKEEDQAVHTAIPVSGEPLPTGEALVLEGMPERGEPAGFLLAGLPLAPAKKAEAHISFNLLVLATVISAAALIISALFVKMLLRQVALLGAGILKVREGYSDVSVPVVTKDELGDVASSFNKLSRGLAETTVSKRYLDSLIESMPDPLIITDEKGSVLRANMAAEAFSGYDFGAPGSVDLRTILEPEAAGAPHPCDALAKGAHIRELDLLLVARDGRRRPAMLSAATAGGQVVVVLKDTAQHKESEARIARYLGEVERVNSELDAFAHTVSHDLKEPLRGIEMFSGMLISDYGEKLDAQATDYLSRVAKAAARMRRLIDDLLDYARISRVRNPYEAVSSRTLVEEAAAGLSAAIEESKASLELDAGLPEIFCDPVKMRQVFHNLISNAVKYNDKRRPEIRIGAELFGRHWKFSVTDNGIGVPPQYYGEIFRMFKRLHSRHEYGGGTGAGLAIVHKVIEEHGGRVWVDSEEGKGSSFRFIIPAAEESDGRVSNG
ncbi:MAG: sensory transduction histidine kinase [Elusimicrobia bacterium]|nr:MAG: sensory transduction histidine kinase [Elusimicrobiota bacterium]KAF0154753.1 MAG: sensory transduction histidine kinase [Elusimicrobiota bacterium]